LKGLADDQGVGNSVGAANLEHRMGITGKCPCDTKSLSTASPDQPALLPRCDMSNFRYGVGGISLCPLPGAAHCQHGA
jgi:hypothetical protein